jgi:hypothetical protein
MQPNLMTPGLFLSMSQGKSEHWLHSSNPLAEQHCRIRHRSFSRALAISALQPEHIPDSARIRMPSFRFSRSTFPSSSRLNPYSSKASRADLNVFLILPVCQSQVWQ